MLLNQTSFEKSTISTFIFLRLADIVSCASFCSNICLILVEAISPKSGSSRALLGPYLAFGSCPPLSFVVVDFQVDNDMSVLILWPVKITRRRINASI